MRGGAAPKRAAVIVRIVREVEAQPTEDRDGATPFVGATGTVEISVELVRRRDSCVSERA